MIQLTPGVFDAELGKLIEDANDPDGWEESRRNEWSRRAWGCL